MLGTTLPIHLARLRDISDHHAVLAVKPREFHARRFGEFPRSPISKMLIAGCGEARSPAVC
jgi:hypothetical protein